MGRMNMLRMSEEQEAAHNARIKGARIIRFESNKTEQQSLKKRKHQKTPKLRPRKLSTEDILALQIERAGLHLERQYHWYPGRKFRADFADPTARLLVELDGAAHRIKGRFHDDIVKSQLALLAGWRLLRISSSQVRQGEAAEIVRQAINATVPF
jgi:very-short-patch-repair endonuclease